jgi:hypothetical protein
VGVVWSIQTDLPHRRAPALSPQQLVWPIEEDLRGQVPAQFAAEGTLDGDRLERAFPDAGWNVAAAPFAGDHKLSPLDDWESEDHRHSKDEDEANMQERKSTKDVGQFRGRRCRSKYMVGEREAVVDAGEGRG